MMKIRWMLTALAVTLTIQSIGITQNNAENLPDFLRSRLKAHMTEYEPLIAREYQSLCQTFRLDDITLQNRRSFVELRFLHDLFTGTSVANGSTGGILEIPYFWHWVEPNPRYAIVYLPNSKPLSQVEPPSGFERYRSYADVDRVPVLFLDDLIAPEEKFEHPLVGTFATFGWCSEREMAFNALLTVFGYRCKIKQDRIHVWSEVAVPFQAKDKEKTLIATIDNTFDTFEWRQLKVPLKQWAEDYGNGDQVKWYNAKSHSAQQIQTIRQISVGARAASRIEKKIKAWLAEDKSSIFPR